MSPRELFLIIAMCVVWGMHFVVMKVTVETIPPIFYAAMRTSLVALLLAPFLRWRGPQMWKVLAAGLCIGAINYAFLFSGLKYATASASAVANELYTPFVTIMSVIFLKEKVGWKRGGGIVLALIGVLIIAMSKQKGASEAQWLGVTLITIGVLLESCGAILIKQTQGFKPIELLAWFALVGAVVLSGLSLVIEDGQVAALRGADKPQVIGAILYSALGASIFGHTAYYWLIQRLPISQVAPSALLTTVMAIFFATVLLGEPLTLSFLVGGLLTMVGVGIVLFRSSKPAPAVDVAAPMAPPIAGGD